MKNIDFLRRTAQLANLADSRVGDNPRVGAVLVSEGRIIGEGYHHRAGEAHAEVNCLASVRAADRHLIPGSTLYVSLEPCCIKGRTPACTGLILREKIRKVVFAQRDTTDEVSGRGAGILREAGVRVKEYPDFEPTLAPNRPRRIYTTEERPMVVLKYAVSHDGFLRPQSRKRDYWITSPLSRRLVHRWRTETGAVIVGARTVLDDDPRLTSRLFPGPDPLPIVLDPRNRLTGKENLLRKAAVPPLVFTGRKPAKLGVDTVELKRGDLSPKSLRQVMRVLRKRRINHVTVEGGQAVLEAFLATEYWDEVRRFTGRARFGNGLAAPGVPTAARLVRTEHLGEDRLDTFRR